MTRYQHDRGHRIREWMIATGAILAPIFALIGILIAAAPHS